MQPTTFGLVLGLVASLGLNGVLATVLIVGPVESPADPQQVVAEVPVPVDSAVVPEEASRGQQNVIDDLDPRYLKDIAKPETHGKLKIPPYDEMTIAWYMALGQPQQLEFWAAILKATPELDAILVDPKERSDVTHWLMNGSCATFEIVRIDHGSDYEKTQLFGDYVPMMIRGLKAADLHPSIKALNKATKK